MTDRGGAKWATEHGDEVEVYAGDDGWRWRVRAGNGEIVGGGESHSHYGDALAAALRHHPKVEPSHD